MNKFAYTTCGQAVEYNFVRAPKILMYERKYQKLSADARFLYIAMLDRLSLSVKNNMHDDENRVYIIMSHKDIRQILGCSDNKITRLLSELDDSKGIGLIKRKRRGLGKPDIIYINSDMITAERTMEENTEEYQEETTCLHKCEETSENITNETIDKHNDETTNEITPDEIEDDKLMELCRRISEKIKPEPHKENTYNTTEYPTTETAQSPKIRECSIKNADSKIVKTVIAESPKGETNNNKYNNNKINNNYINNNQSYLKELNYNNSELCSCTDFYEFDFNDLIEDRIETKKYVKETMGYEVLVQEYNKKTVDSIVTVITDAICSQKECLRIGGEYMPHREAKKSLLGFDYSRAESVLTGLKNLKTDIVNVPAYLLTAVYNSKICA